MNAALWIAILEHPWQAGHRTADRHISVGTPDNVLRLLPEPALLGPAVALVPDGGAAPDPASPLEGVPIKGRRRVLPHAGILLGGGLVFLGLRPASGSIRGIGDDGIEGVGGEPAQHLQRVTLNDLPFLVIVHVCGPPCFCFLWEYCRITLSLHTR